MKGTFISFEGIEGTGKSTQAKLLYNYLREKGADVILTEEPGGTQISVKIREVLLSVEHKEMSPLTELLLYNASRAQHIQEVIMPALDRGAIVITDRFTDSTLAYQGYGRGLDLQLIDSIDLIATGRLRPDITLLLDLDVQTGLKRNRGINKTDRLELEDVPFHERVRNGYQMLAEHDPARIKLISVTAGIDEIHRSIIHIISGVLGS
ncbi:MAG TPA: dTMP kinase [Thermodesulfovibrionales bacterium]|nr:dTMP kinase [Thermodesulfovibrionales bacterium]